MTIIVKSAELVRGVHKLIKMKRSTRTADDDVHCDFASNLDPYIVAGVEKNAENVWIEPVDENWS